MLGPMGKGREDQCLSHPESSPTSVGGPLRQRHGGCGSARASSPHARRGPQPLVCGFWEAHGPGYMGLAATMWAPMGTKVPVLSPNDDPNPSPGPQEGVQKK